MAKVLPNISTIALWPLKTGSWAEGCSNAPRTEKIGAVFVALESSAVQVPSPWGIRSCWRRMEEMVKFVNSF